MPLHGRSDQRHDRGAHGRSDACVSPRAAAVAAAGRFVAHGEPFKKRQIIRAVPTLRKQIIRKAIKVFLDNEAANLAGKQAVEPVTNPHPVVVEGIEAVRWNYCRRYNPALNPFRGIL